MLDGIVGQFIDDPFVDTANHAHFGDRDVQTVVANRQFSDMGKALDSISIPAMAFPIGKSKLLFYAVTQDYFDYRRTFEGGTNPRVAPKYNVSGGAGVFAGMLADTFEVNLAAFPGVKVYPNEAARETYCAGDDFETQKVKWLVRKECRELLLNLCSDGWEIGRENDTINYCETWPATGKPTNDTDLRTFCTDRNWQISAYPECKKFLNLQ
jgi:hypothetical protein